MLGMRAQLSDFAWTEAEKAGKLAARMDTAHSAGGQSHVMQQPMFCVETALKLHRWCQLAYSEYGQRGKGGQASMQAPARAEDQDADLVRGRTHAALDGANGVSLGACGGLKFKNQMLPCVWESCTLAPGIWAS